MKKIISIAFMFMFVFLLAGCGNDVKDIDVTKTKTDTYHELSFAYPDVFEKEPNELTDFGRLHYSETYRYEIQSKKTLIGSCSFNFVQDTYEKDVSLEKYVTNLQQEGKGTKKTINGVEWLVYKEQFYEDMTVYYYYAKYNKKYYQFWFYDMAKEDKCLKTQELIEQSLKFVAG